MKIPHVLRYVSRKNQAQYDLAVYKGQPRCYEALSLLPAGCVGSQREFAEPAPRKMVKRRNQSPPCLRNIFLDGGISEDDAQLQAVKLPKHPPPQSRYR